MKIWKKAVMLLSVFCICFTLSYTDAAAEEEAYTYTVTFYAGNQGTFANSNGLSVRYNLGKIDVKSDKITVSGLKFGDIVSFDAQAGALGMGDANKYYIKGIRESGRDNNTVTASAFKVDGDADYVVAYGIKGDTVGYRVNYQDTAGNTLAPSKTYYGNVGDKAVAAYLYIEGYTPQALALAKTLTANENENVLTFVYVADEAPGTEETPTGGTTTTPAGGTTTTPTGGATTTPAGGGTTTTPAGGGAPADGGAAPADGGAADAADAAQDGAGDANAPGEAGENLPDDEVPLDQPLLDVDDEKTPTGNVILDEKNQKKLEKGLPLALRIGIGAAAATALAVLAIILFKRRKSAKTVTNNIEENRREHEKENK